MDEDRLARVQALLGDTSLEETWTAPTSKPQEMQNPTSSDSDDYELMTSKERSDRVVQTSSTKNLRSSSVVPEAPATDNSTTEDRTDLGETSDWEEYQFGQLAAENERFCPWQTIKKYPSYYIGNTNRPKVDKRFFANDKLSNKRSWDIFYLHHTEENKPPILLVPTKQFQDFLNHINKKLNISLTIPHVGPMEGFEFTFPDNGTPRPRYLGKSTNSKMIEDFVKGGVPPKEYAPRYEQPSTVAPTDRSLEAYRAKINLMSQTQKGKKLANKEKAKADRIARQKSWSSAIKRVQRYLGLRDLHHDYRGELTRIREKYKAQGLEWLELAEAVDRDAAKIPSSVKFDADHPSFFPTEDSVVFVCIDVEAWERNQKIITEIGVSTLDTEDIKNIAPGKGGENWMKAIRARHFRIIENQHYENKDFVRGCADKFEFGESEFIHLRDVSSTVAACFKYPFSGPSADNSGPEVTERNIILVGHDVDADISFLRGIGYNVLNLRNLKEKHDTASMYRYLRREPNPRNLGHILADLGLVGWNLHNAGNDAMYTLQAMIGISIEHIVEKQKNKERREKEFQDRKHEALNEAEEKFMEQEEGWSSDEEGSDGGEAVATALPMRGKNQTNPQPTIQSPPIRTKRYNSKKEDNLLVDVVEVGGSASPEDPNTPKGSPIKKSKITVEDVEEVNEMW